MCNLSDTLGELLLAAVGVAVRALTSARNAPAPACVPTTQAAERMSIGNALASDADALELGLSVYFLSLLSGLAIAIEDVAVAIQLVAIGIVSIIVYKIWCRLALNDLHNQQLEVEKHRNE